MSNNKSWVKFVRGSQDAWDILQQTPEKINDDTLYFIYEDNNFSTVSKLYLGNKLISDNDMVTLNSIKNVQINEELLSNNQILIYNEENETWKNISLNDIIDLTDYYNKNEIDALIPSKTSDLINDNNFLNSTEVSNQIINAISNISTLSFQIVNQKPNINIQNNIIYLIPKQNSENENIYEEWIYINNNWELIGTTNIDLSNYVENNLTIAGINLQDDISTEELKNALSISNPSIPIVPSDKNGEPDFNSSIYQNLNFYQIFRTNYGINDNGEAFYWIKTSSAVKLNKVIEGDSIPRISSSSLGYPLGTVAISSNFGIYILYAIDYDTPSQGYYTYYWSHPCKIKYSNSTDPPPFMGNRIEDAPAIMRGDLYINNEDIYVCTDVSSTFNYGDSHRYTWKSLLSNKEDISNKVTSLSNQSTDTQYPSAKAVYDTIENISLTPGPAGADGKSAYQIAVDNGFVGTEQQWLASLVGQTGATGAQGPAGADWVPTENELNNIATRVINLLPSADEEVY